MGRSESSIRYLNVEGFRCEELMECQLELDLTYKLTWALCALTVAMRPVKAEREIVEKCILKDFELLCEREDIGISSVYLLR